jgi:hypothetical protein
LYLAGLSVSAFLFTAGLMCIIFGSFLHDVGIEKYKSNFSIKDEESNLDDLKNTITDILEKEFKTVLVCGSLYTMFGFVSTVWNFVALYVRLGRITV